MSADVQSWLDSGGSAIADKESTNVFVKFFEDDLESLGNGVSWFCRDNGPEQSFHIQVPQHMSSWWKDPKITIMSVQEFERYS